MARSIPHSRPSLGACEREQLDAVIASGYIAPGDRSRALGALAAQRYGCSYGLAVNSCASALHLALLALGVGRGDRVAVPGLVCPAVLHPIRYVGGEVVFVDVTAADHQIDVDRLRALHATAPVAAVVVPHRYGAIADVGALRGTGIRIIEDGAQSFGASCGSASRLQGDAGVFSFYATKMLATGCGGALITSDAAIARFAEAATDYYSGGAAAHEATLYNYRMPDLNAALGLAQLARLDQFIARRRQLAARYRDRLGRDADLVAPADATGSAHYRFVVRLRDRAERDAALARSAAAGCGMGEIDSVPGALGALPISEGEWGRCVSLPIYPELTEQDQDRIVACLQEGR